MVVTSISNRKLHCCLLILILFILIFLSLPLLLIYLANTSYEESENQRTLTEDRNGSASSSTNSNNSSTNSNNTSSSGGGSGGSGSNSHNHTRVPLTVAGGSGLPGPVTEISSIIASNQQTPPINCTQFAVQANLSLADENFHCPMGTFPCQSCPNICIEQRRNCDGHPDCPDRSDEGSSCHDSNGAMANIFQTIVEASSKNKNKPGNSATSLAKPESCTMEQFEQEQCPCLYTEPRVIICEGIGLTSVPSSLLQSVYKIRMSNNSIDTIDNVWWPRSLSSLVLVNNRIAHIGPATFEKTPNLSKLYLSHNEISYIDSEAFIGLAGLTLLQIEANKLRSFDSRLLAHTPQVSKLYLSENMIDLPDETRFGICRNLKELLLDHNRISAIRSHWFSNMTSLIWLSLMHNEIATIEPNSFDWDYELEELNLSFNKIKTINRQMFARGLNIQRLYLGGNPLRVLPRDAFQEIVMLKSLNLTDVEFDYIQRDTFTYLAELDFIYFAKFRYCHYAEHVRVCRPLTDGLSSKGELLAFPILKYAVWIVASVCSLGNVFVFIWRTVSSHEDRTLSLFVRNLSIADLMMGIYLAGIGWQNWKFQHNFGAHAIEWMSSWTCMTIGFLAILSSELSVFILCIITIERYRSIMSTNTYEEAAQKRRARVYVALAWLFSLLIASYPLIEWLFRDSDYYATNGLCLPLHIDQPFTPGWQYSAFVYLGINFTAVMVIIVLYVHMYSMIMDGRQASRPALFKAEKREDAILAIRFFFIVVTDCLCWIPIVVIKIVALANVNISSAIYGWLVVFIIPINSALNPIIYTLAAPTSLRAAVFRLFERFCCKLDQLMLAGASSGAGKGPGGGGGGAGGVNNYSSSKSSSAGSGGSSSSSASQATIATINSRRRNNTGSNSTTCDTFETSIVSSQHSRELVSSISESAPFIHAPTTTTGPTTIVCLSTMAPLCNHPATQDNAGRTAVASAAAAYIVADRDDSAYTDAGDDDDNQSDDDDDDDDDSNECAQATINAALGTPNRPYDCLSTYEDSSIRHTLITDRAPTTTDRTRRRLSSHDQRPPPAYDSIEWRASSILRRGLHLAGKRRPCSSVFCATGDDGEQCNNNNNNNMTSHSSSKHGHVCMFGGESVMMTMVDEVTAAPETRSAANCRLGRRRGSNRNGTNDTTLIDPAPIKATNPATVTSPRASLSNTESPAAKLSSRHTRVSFSSKDSRQCLLGGQMNE